MGGETRGDCSGAQRRRFSTVFAVVVVGATLAGCQDLKVVPLPAANVTPLTGQMTYYLPRTSIVTSVTLTVTRCDGIDASPQVPGADATTEDVNVAATVTPVAVLEPDTDFGYAIDYAAARSWLKETQFQLNTGPGKLFQSLNATVNDQSGPIVVAALTTAVQIAGSAILPAASIAAPRAVGIPHRSNMCTDQVDRALTASATIQNQITALKRKISHYYATLGAAPDGTLPGKDDPTTAWLAAISALQTALASAQKPLTYSFTTTWTPAATDFSPTTTQTGEPVVAGTHEIPVSTGVAKFLANPGNCDPLATDSAPFKQLLRPLLLKAVIDPVTYFGGTKDGSMTPSVGLVTRDPATGLVQICTPRSPDTNMLAKDSDGQWRYATAQKNTLCPTPGLRSAVLADGTGKTTDDSTRIRVTLPQLGRPIIYTAHSGVFENATLGLTMASDGSMTQVATHDLSTAAGGLSGLGGAATAAATAEAAHNTAVGAVNTALGVQVSLPDTINKALADCLAQAKAATLAGGKPVPCQ